jgi:hypothetical protein
MGLDTIEVGSRVYWTTPTARVCSDRRNRFRCVAQAGHSCAEVKRKMRTIAPFSTCWCGEVPRFRRRFNVSPPAHVPNWKSTSSQDYLLLARRPRELPRVRIDKEYRFEIDEGSALLADLFRGRSHSSSSRRTSCRHASFAIRRRRCSRSSSLPRI